MRGYCIQGCFIFGCYTMEEHTFNVVLVDAITRKNCEKTNFLDDGYS